VTRAHAAEAGDGDLESANVRDHVWSGQLSEVSGEKGDREN
jgi:hypothetical protein